MPKRKKKTARRRNATADDRVAELTELKLKAEVELAAKKLQRIWIAGRALAGLLANPTLRVSANQTRFVFAVENQDACRMAVLAADRVLEIAGEADPTTEDQ